MKNIIGFVLIVTLLYSCNTQIKTDERKVSRIETTIEYLVIDENFTKDTTKYKTSIKKYDANNNLLEEMDYFNNIFYGGLIYKYNSENKKTNEYLISSNGDYTHYEYKHLPNQIDKYRIYKNKHQEKVESTFLDSNSISNDIVMSEQNQRREIFTYESYDNKGNWLIRKSFKNDMPHSVTYKSIEYRNESD